MKSLILIRLLNNNIINQMKSTIKKSIGQVILSRFY
jgi:hypothetical protein